MTLVALETFVNVLPRHSLEYRLAMLKDATSASPLLSLDGSRTLLLVPHLLIFFATFLHNQCHIDDLGISS